MSLSPEVYRLAEIAIGKLDSMMTQRRKFLRHLRHKRAWAEREQRRYQHRELGWIWCAGRKEAIEEIIEHLEKLEQRKS